MALKIQTRWLKIFLSIFFIFLTMRACTMDEFAINPFPRHEELPLFDPHMESFDCKVEAQYVPPIDAEAQTWFVQARSLEDSQIYVEDRDYPRIVQLTRQAAERRHWKAMLNLASLYVEGRDPTKGIEDAVQLVESAMRLGIPAAYDRMGTYYMNGTGVPPDATKAFAFWQRAARMGNPQAMAHLADKLRAARDSAIPGYWANIPVAVKCSSVRFRKVTGRQRTTCITCIFILAHPKDYKSVAPHQKRGRVPWLSCTRDLNWAARCAVLNST